MLESTTKVEREDNIYQNTYKKPSEFSGGFLFLNYKIALLKKPVQIWRLHIISEKRYNFLHEYRKVLPVVFKGE